MSFGDGDLHKENDELREILLGALARLRTAERLSGMVYLDARFKERVKALIPDALPGNGDGDEA